MNWFLSIFSLVNYGILTWIIIDSIKAIGPKFNFGRICVSNLGNRKINPHWKYFCIGEGMCSIGLIPLLISFYQHWPLVWGYWAYIPLILATIGNCGLIGVGFINEADHFPTHFVLGVMGLAGYAFAMVTSLLLSLVGIIIQWSWPSIFEFLLVIIPIFVGLLGILRITRIPKTNDMGLPELQWKKPMNNDNRMEWVLYFMVLWWNLGMIIITP